MIFGGTGGGNVFSGSIPFHTFTWMFESAHNSSFTITIYLVVYINITSTKVCSINGVAFQCLNEVFV